MRTHSPEVPASAGTTSEKGRFITLEGGEGVGKSTQLSALAEALTARGLDVVTTREPCGSDGAEAIRRLLLEGDGLLDGPVTPRPRVPRAA